MKYCSHKCRRMRVILICKTCSKQFILKPSALKKGFGKYCSKKCYGQSQYTGTQIICESCKKSFYLNKSQLVQGRGRYCSDECRYKNSTKIITCPVCGKQKRKTNSQLDCNNNYCSTACSNIGRRKRVTITCIHCNKQFEVINSAKDRTKFCSRKCRNAHPVTEKQRQHLINNRLHQVFPSNDSKLELAIRQVLIDLSITFITQYAIKCGYVAGQFDFAIISSKLFIECDGDYWHNVPKNMKQDRLKERYCRDYGWILIRFSEGNIKNDLEGCRETIKRVLSTTDKFT